MSSGEVVLGGTLRVDGTLQLDQKPNLAPGRVTVVVRQEGAPVSPRPLGQQFFQMMNEIWAGQQARRFAPRSLDDFGAERKQLQAEAEQELEAAIRLQEESRCLRAQMEGEKQSP